MIWHIAKVKRLNMVSAALLITVFDSILDKCYCAQIYWRNRSANYFGRVTFNFPLEYIDVYILMRIWSCFKTIFLSSFCDTKTLLIWKFSVILHPHITWRQVNVVPLVMGSNILCVCMTHVAMTDQYNKGSRATESMFNKCVIFLLNPEGYIKTWCAPSQTWSFSF